MKIVLVYLNTNWIHSSLKCMISANTTLHKYVTVNKISVSLIDFSSCMLSLPKTLRICERERKVEMTNKMAMAMKLNM